MGEEVAIFGLNKFFFNYEEKSTFVTAQGLMLLKKKSEKVELEFMSDTVESMYNNCENGYVSPYKGTEFNQERICNFFGTRYCDDQNFIEDVKTKKSLQKLLYILNENEQVLSLENSTKSVLLHIFNELDRNIRNHSGIMDKDNQYYDYMFMVYPNSRQLNIVLLDEGKGIHGSLYYQDGRDPVLEAVKKGVSSHSNHIMTNGGGRNSGYGLYLMNQLSKGNHILEIVDNKKYYCSEKGIGLEKNECGNEFLENLDKFTMISLIVDLKTITDDLLKIENMTEGKSSKSSVTNLSDLEFEELKNLIYKEL